MAYTSNAEFVYPTQREAFVAELEMAFNFVKFAASASDPELANYVHAKARESYRRLAKLTTQARSAEADLTNHALRTLRLRIEEFQGKGSKATF
jgi:cobalamin biosynthesis Mg chelatase CobN